jgi:glycosyltransferase involved in cell wall biosynthesis
MPLENREWEKGKCGFKALQYMALAIPAVASPVGVNTEIIRHGESGFLCKDEEAWYNILLRLAVDDDLRRVVGHRGRDTVEQRYSSASLKTRFLDLLISG